MENPKAARRTRSLLQELRAQRHEDLIVRWRERETDGTLAEAYAEAARRLASSFASQPYDDQILLPFLFMYRHAIELDLKHAIREAVKLRRMADRRELPTAVELEGKLRRYGHRLDCAR